MRFVECRCGKRHWGPFGAAGLLLTAHGRVLLQHRAEGVHDGDCWGLPGGALEPGESAVEAALRETAEEVHGVDPGLVRVVTQVGTTDHDVWRYVTVVARLDAADLPRVAPANWESTTVEWIDTRAVGERRLHPGLAAAWPELAGHVRDT